MKKFSSFLSRVALLSFVSLAIAPAIIPFISSEALASSVVSVTSGADDVNDNKLVETMCNALKIVTGSGGKAFAAFAIISVGIGFFTGKVSWGLLIGVAMGIAAMFGAPSIVAALSDGSRYECV